MKLDKILLMKKANGIVQSIEKMSPQERSLLPTHSFGEDYNKLRSMVIQADAALVEYMPPVVTFEEFGMNGELISKQRYSEIHGFCRQIVEFLSQ